MDKSGVAVQKFVVVENRSEISSKVNGFSKFDQFIIMITEQTLLMTFCGNFCYLVYLEVDEYVVKAQVHAGGRGKGHFDTGFKGGVHILKE